jgi:hypothetical protein
MRSASDNQGLSEGSWRSQQRNPETVRYLLMVLVLIIGAFYSLATASALKWFLLEPPVEGTSELGRVLDEAPIAQWNRIGTYDTEGTCEAHRNEAVKATREETMRLTKSSPLPSIDMWRAAERDRRRAEASDCISADDPRLRPTLSR